MRMEPSNHCRQFAIQANRYVEVPSIPDALRARFLHGLDLCRASQKFMLPDGGMIFEDRQLKGLDETEQLRLPHPFIALEYVATNDNQAPGATELATKRIVFASEDAEWISITPAVCLNSNGMWGVYPSCRVPTTNYLERPATSGTQLPSIAIQYQAGVDPSDYHDEVATLLRFLSALSCTNVHIESRPPRKAGKKIKSALPFDTYHVLTIDVGKQSSGQHAGETGAGRSPREHLRRGHIRRLADGRRIWVNATVVAAGKTAGTVKKDYIVRQHTSEPRR